MITDASNVENGSQLRADLVIIGSGPAGVSIARRFIGLSTNVIVLESGGETYDQRVQNLAGGDISGQYMVPLDASRLRFLGGSSNHWAGWCHPLEKEDFEARSDWPESGWPISKQDLDSYYAQAAEVCQLHGSVFDDPEYWQSLSGNQDLSALELDSRRLITRIFQISPPTKFGTAYRQELEQAKNINLLLNATVLEILKDKESTPGSAQQKASGVLVGTLDKKQFQIDAGAVVIAAGGIESCRLLLLSKQFHPAGAGNESDQVGRYFMDHPWITSAAYLKFFREGQNWPLYFDQTPVKNTRIFGILAPSPELKLATGAGGFRLWLHPSAQSTAGVDSLRSLLDDIKKGEMPDQLGEHLANIYGDFDQVIDSVYKTLFNVRQSPFGQSHSGSSSQNRNSYQGASIDLNIEQRPNRDSRLTLGDSLDELGQPRINVDWRLTESDWLTAQTALQALAQEAGRSNLGRVRNSMADDYPNWPGIMRGSFHHMGGARMSSDNRDGVVDANCKVHSIDNLYVASSAVFPTSGFANPTLTIVALSLRLADHLTELFKNER